MTTDAGAASCKRRTPFLRRGLVRKAQGDAARARADYRKALEVAPADWPHRAAVERELRALGP